jgi:phage baseplate assembly protein gpV
MDRFLNVMKAQAAALDRAQGQPRFALVASVDPARYSVRVLLQPEGVLTGWLPVLSAWVGAGWGMACLPAPGDQVLVLAQEGDGEHGVVVGAAFSDQVPPPAAPAGELWLRHRSGVALKLTNDGTLRIEGPVHVAGNVYIEGTLYAQDIADAAGSLSRLRSRYNAHLHPGQVTVLPVPQDS